MIKIRTLLIYIVFGVLIFLYVAVDFSIRLKEDIKKKEYMDSLKIENFILEQQLLKHQLEQYKK